MATSMEHSLEPSAEHHHKHSHKRHHHKKHKKKHDKSEIKENKDKKELVLNEQVLLQALTSLDDQLMKDSNSENTGDEGDRPIAAMDRTTGQQCIVDTEKKLTSIKGDSDSSMVEQPQDKDGSCVNDSESDSKTIHDKKHSKKKKKKHSKHKSSHHKRKHHSKKHSSRSASRTRYRSRSHSRSRSRSRARYRSRTRSNSRTKYSRKKSHSRSRSRTRYSRTRYRSRTRSSSRTKYSKRLSRSRSPRYSRTQSHSRTYPGCRYRSRTRSYSPERTKARHKTWYRHDNRRQSSSRYSSSDSDQGRDRKKRAESHTPPPQTIPTIITKPGDIKKETIAEYTKMCQQLSELEKTGTNDSTEGTTTAVQHHPFQMNEAVVLPGMTANQLVLEMKPVEQVFPVSSGKEHQSSTVPQAQQQPAAVEDNEPVNVSALVVERAMLQQQLKANSNDIHVVLKLSAVEKKLANWSQGHVKPGLFTGGSEVIPMPKWEHDRGVQAWAKKNMFKSLAPVMSGFGMKMLVRMGWEMGQPLGKRGEGHTEPIPVDVKVDRQGLATVEDKQAPSVPSNVPAVTGKTSLAGKHPVSALQELCSKKSWGSPEYILISETGPSHMRSFMFKVTVEGVGTFQAACCSNNKKLAKAQAAIACLKSLGIFEEQEKNNQEKNDQENTQK